MGSVSDLEINIAIKNGVVIVKLDPGLNMKRESPRVSAISYRTGVVIFNDREAWVLHTLKKYGISIIEQEIIWKHH